MKASAFEYHAARSLSGATDLLARYATEDARILAGGQSLVPAMALRVAAPAHLIDINGIEELQQFTASGEVVGPVRVTVNEPGLPGASDAEGSEAATLTCGSVLCNGRKRYRHSPAWS